MSTALAIFVKTPGLSPLKTRLAVGIGEEAALNFYEHSLEAIEETLKQTDMQPHWAVAEKDGLSHHLWQSFPALHTGEGGLGERQHHIYETLLNNHDKVILIGADAPQISPDLLMQAQEILKTHNFVMGPAHDGGYYLFGGRMPVAKEVWTSVEYSQETTRTVLIGALPEAPVLLPLLSDVDTKDNLADIVAEMPEHPNAAQRNLIDWIEAL